MNTQLQTQAKEHAKSSFMYAPSGLLQRKCACGQHTVAGGECAECRKKRLQRKAAGHADPETAPPIVQEVLRSPGQPLDAETRAFMEPRFGHDFSQVRMHTDGRAAESARAVNALAYTVGRDVVFGVGQYTLGTATRRLLAHELTHVVQQGSTVVTTGPLTLGPLQDRHEQEADTVATQIVAGTPHTVKSRTQTPSVQRNGGPIMSGDPDAEMRRLEAQLRRNALAGAQSLERNYPGWRDVLPDCPCTDQEAQDSSVFTDREEANQTYHPGATTCHRSARGYASVEGTSHGQQCCYDASGNLITQGPGAGTPDFWAPIGLNIVRHYFTDVVPFNRLGWRIYNQYWIPNKGNGCEMGDFPIPSGTSRTG